MDSANKIWWIWWRKKPGTELILILAHQVRFSLSFMQSLKDFTCGSVIVSIGSAYIRNPMTRATAYIRHLMTGFSQTQFYLMQRFQGLHDTFVKIPRWKQQNPLYLLIQEILHIKSLARMGLSFQEQLLKWHPNVKWEGGCCPCFKTAVWPCNHGEDALLAQILGIDWFRMLVCPYTPGNPRWDDQV